MQWRGWTCPARSRVSMSPTPARSRWLSYRKPSLLAAGPLLDIVGYDLRVAEIVGLVEQRIEASAFGSVERARPNRRRRRTVGHDAKIACGRVAPTGFARLLVGQGGGR